MRSWFSLAALVASVVLTACAASLDPQVKSRIKTVVVDVKLSDLPGVSTPGSGTAAILSGNLGASNSDVRSTYQAVVQRHVNVAAVIEATARSELQQRGFRVLERGQPSDARLKIEGAYALGLVSLPIDPRRRAMTTLYVTLVDAEGRVLWGNQGFGLTTPAYKERIRFAPYEQWFEKEAFAGEQHRLSAEMVTIELFKNF